MKRNLWILTAGACLVAAAALLGDQAAEKAGEEAARKAAEGAAKSWLALIDSGKYAESWSEASTLFKKQITSDQWEKTVTSVRDSLGGLKSRKLKTADYTRTLPGAPDGEYVVIQYDSSFENKKEAVETVVPMKEKDGVWRISGYFIK